MSKPEQFNSLVRAIAVLLLLAGFVFAFIWGVIYKVAIIDGAAYIGVLTLALTWWFKSKDEEQKSQDTKEAVAAAVTPLAPVPNGGKREDTSGIH